MPTACCAHPDQNNVPSRSLVNLITITHEFDHQKKNGKKKQAFENLHLVQWYKSKAGSRSLCSLD